MPTSSNASTKERNPLSISQLNRQAKRLLEANFPSVWVEGEISNFARPSSGHWYFSLKDANAQVRCAMFRSSNARLAFTPKEGQQVLARAKLSLYEARGDYQLIVEHLEDAGAGALAKAFEALKLKLKQEGLFDQSLKKELPDLPKHIAVITSPTGAAIRDILTVLARRFPQIPVTIIPVAVQGEPAAQEIANAIELANQLAKSKDFDFDVILTGRGGGSIEDLWAFNEEVVARAISASDLPVVSAVGHEIDFTIADFVADQRAATPSAAAELLSPDQFEYQQTLIGFEQLLARQILLQLEQHKQQLVWLKSRLKHPGSQLQEHSQRLDELETRLINAWHNQLKHRMLETKLLNARLQQQQPGHEIALLKTTAKNLYRRLEHNVEQQLTIHQQKLSTTMQLLDMVSPLATLERGYAIVTTEKGEVITDAATLEKGQRINTKLAKGEVISSVEKIK